MATPYDIEPSPSSPITTEMLMRWKAYMSAIPLPHDGVPRGGIPLENVSREALLACPPQVLAHIIQTASQGGLEVISPRQTPLSATMVRRSGRERYLGDHDVFSRAEAEPVWPCITPGDDDDLDFLLPDEPMAPRESVITKREKTRTKTLVTQDLEVADPVLMCLLKGRATIDILNRIDVGGDGTALAMLLIAAWGLEADDLMDLGAYTLGVDGPLQRHAMKVDEVFPTMYAPVQARSCITVGNVDTSKALLLPDLAIDWARCRVFCEAVFYNSCVIEGLPLRYMGVPHNASAAGSIANAYGVVTFQPNPSISWSYAPSTFALTPTATLKARRAFTIPDDVRNALQLYVKKVRPVSFVLAQTPRVVLKQTQARRTNPLSGETIASAYSRTVAAMSTGTARGKNSSAALRNAIYVCLEGASRGVQLRMARYTEITVQECREHLGVGVVPLNVIRDLAHQFKDVGSTIREHLAREAERRGSNITEWWRDATAQVPQDMADMTEGSFSWAMVGLWLLFRQPTDRWKNLERALSLRAHFLGTQGAACCMALPAEKGSLVRLLAAAQGSVKSISEAWYGYYKAVADVGHAVGREAERMGRKREAAACVMGAKLWEFRARALKASNVHPQEKAVKKKSEWHFRIKATPTDLVVRPAPYRAFECLRDYLHGCPFVHKRALMPMDEYEEEKGPISPVFKACTSILMPCKPTKVTTYVAEPWKMATDLEKGWKFIVDDLNVVAKIMKEEHEETAVKKRQKVEEVTNMTEFEFEMPELAPMDAEGEGAGLRSFWALYGNLDSDISMGLDDRIAMLPDHVADDVYNGSYENMGALLAMINRLEQQELAASTARHETVK